MYTGYEITFDGKGEWSFGNDYSRNFIIFGVDNSSSSHTDNLKNNLIILGKGDTSGLNGSFGAPEEKLSTTFSKANTKFCLSLHCNADNSFLLMEKKSLNLKPTIKLLTFQLDFVKELYPMDLVVLILEKYL